jgi:hypothetical protein
VVRAEGLYRRFMREFSENPEPLLIVLSSFSGVRGLL